jgi:MFS family permease
MQLAGPAFGALCGGFVGAAFGWRATFIAVAMLAGVVMLPLLLACVGETHQYKVAKRQAATDETCGFAEAEAILSQPPKLLMPWTPVASLFERAVILHVMVAFIGISALYLSAVILPSHLAAAPYNMSTSDIGLSMLVTLIGVVVSPPASYLFDKAGSLCPTEPMVRLTYSTAVALLMMPAGLLLFGWGLHAHAHIAVLVVGWVLIGASTFWVAAAMYAYMTYIKPGASSTVAGIVSGNVVLSGVIIMAGVAMAEAVGMLRMFILLACMSAVVATAAAAQIYCRFKKSKGSSDVSAASAV